MQNNEETPNQIHEDQQEIEEAILGIAISENKSLGLIEDILKRSDFKDSRNGFIFELVLELFQRGQYFDSMIISDEVEKRGILKKIGGLTHLAEVEDNSFGLDDSRILEYAKIIKERSVARKINFNLKLIQAEIEKGKLSGEPLQTKIADIQAGIEKELGKGKPEWTTASDALGSLAGQIQRVQEGGENDSSIKFGFDRIDKRVGGADPGDLVVIAGRPSMGKTAFALKLTKNILTDDPGRVGAFFSIETTKEKIASRMAAQTSRICISEFRNKKDFGVDSWDKMNIALDIFDSQKLMLIDMPSDEINITKLKAICRRIHAAYGRLDFIVIDYIQMLAKSTNSSERAVEIGQIAKGLKSIGKELQFPTYALAQLNRGVETRSEKRPTMADLKESGELEQDAELIMMLYRDHYYNPEKADPVDAEVLVEKCKDGEPGTEHLEFRGEYVDFRDKN